MIWTDQLDYSTKYLFWGWCRKNACLAHLLCLVISINDCNNILKVKGFYFIHHYGYWFYCQCLQASSLLRVDWYLPWN